jgi:hypothetical protein
VNALAITAAPRTINEIMNKVGNVDVPDEITACLTRKCNGNARYRQIIDASSGSFSKENHKTLSDTNNAADLETLLRFASPFRDLSQHILHMWSYWICDHFKQRGLYQLTTQSARRPLII